MNNGTLSTLIDCANCHFARGRVARTVTARVRCERMPPDYECSLQMKPYASQQYSRRPEHSLSRGTFNQKSVTFVAHVALYQDVIRRGSARSLRSCGYETRRRVATTQPAQENVTAVTKNSQQRERSNNCGGVRARPSVSEQTRSASERCKITPIQARSLCISR